MNNAYYLQDVFSEYLIVKGYSSKSRETMGKAMLYFARWCMAEGLELPAVTYNEVLAYVNCCRQKGNVQKTIQFRLGHVSHYYQCLISREELTDNPCSNVAIRGIKRRRLQEHFSPEELDTIYKQYRSANQLVYKRNKVMLGLIVYQGLRSEELARLTANDVHAREGKVSIAGSLKSNERELSLASHQLYDIMDYLNETRKLFMAIRGTESDRLFLSTGSSDKFHNLMQRFTAQLIRQDKRIKAINQLRASVISNWLKQHNLRKVQYLAGHRYVSATEAYQRGNMDSLIEDVNNYHPDL